MRCVNYMPSVVKKFFVMIFIVNLRFMLSGVGKEFDVSKLGDTRCT